MIFKGPFATPYNRPFLPRAEANTLTTRLSCTQSQVYHPCIHSDGQLMMTMLLQDSLLSKLGEIDAEKGADNDARIVEAYKAQSIAEAQEG